MSRTSEIDETIEAKMDRQQFSTGVVQNQVPPAEQTLPHPEQAARPQPHRETSLPLTGDLGLRNAREVHDRLREAISGSDNIDVDLGSLMSLDISIVQLLLAARKTAAARGKSFRLVNISGPAREFLAGAGLLGADGAARGPEEEFWLGQTSEENAA